jgi:hypothetical protein
MRVALRSLLLVAAVVVAGCEASDDESQNTDAQTQALSAAGRSAPRRSGAGAPAPRKRTTPTAGSSAPRKQTTPTAGRKAPNAGSAAF